MNTVISTMQNWVSQVIVKYNFCPFARQEVESNSIHYFVSQAISHDDAVMDMLEQCSELNHEPERETTLVIFDKGFSNFDDFLDLVDLANALLVAQGFEGTYQIATFHPDYVFADSDELAPPPPQPWRCFQIGGSIARAAAASPWKVAIIASSSWSHSFLTAKNSLLFPDVESDKRYYDALCSGDYDTWRNTTIEEAEDRGHHELLNWFCLVGAMSELDRKPTEAVFMESWISNSNKTFAVFRP